MFASTNLPQVTEEIRLNDRELNEIYSLSELCLPLSTIAAFLSLPPAFLHQLFQNDERLRISVYAGRSKAEKSIAEALFKSAVGGNVTAAIWLEKTRFGHSENGRNLETIDASAATIDENTEQLVS